MITDSPLLDLFITLITNYHTDRNKIWEEIIRYRKVNQKMLMEEFNDDPELYRLVTKFFKSYDSMCKTPCHLTFRNACATLKNHIKTNYINQDSLEWL